MLGSVDDKKGPKRQPLRSSIACQRCRKSKIKCNNSGADAPCETCIKSGKECVYPDAAPAPPKRPDPPAIKSSEQGGSERKRLKKLEEVGRQDNVSSAALFAEEVLSAPYLSENMWTQIFDIYRQHFATELPFLHLPTLREKMGNKSRRQKDNNPEINLVLLGVLTLTARFHSTLVSYVANTKAITSVPNKQRPGYSTQDPSGASEYFAEALTKALGGLRTSMTAASVERVQAFLMLGLYEWSQSQPSVGGLGAWMYIGVAIRMAQALGLGYGDQPDKVKYFKRPTKVLKPPVSAGEAMIAKEVRRRTMFSCLILDRMLGCGMERVSTIRSEDLQIQLPCSEAAFNLSEEVFTGFLISSPHDKHPADLNDCVLSRFVRLVDLWGEISRWSFAGGRFKEVNPPWHPESKFFQLRGKLDAFLDDLPEVFRWSRSNYHKHDELSHQASGVYVSLHMLSALCHIMLHREYIPFIPLRCDRPIGPLDEPTFDPNDVPEGFWEESAEELFRAAKQIVDLIEICREKLPMSALVLFSVWTAAFVGIVAAHFPHMDQQRHMQVEDDEDTEGSPVPRASVDIKVDGPTGLTFKTLNQMSNWLKMAVTYVGYFKDMDRYYERVIRDFNKHKNGRSGRQHGEGNVGVRHGGHGGGLDEWQKEASKIVDNGAILATPDDERPPSHAYDSPGSTMERSSSIGQDSYRTDRMGTPRSTPSAFTAINSSGHHGQYQQRDQEARYEGSLASEQRNGWTAYGGQNFVPPPPQNQHQQMLAQQQGSGQDSTISPSQSPYLPQGPLLQHIASLAAFGNSADSPPFNEYLNQHQAMRIHDLPGSSNVLGPLVDPYDFSFMDYPIGIPLMQEVPGMGIM